MSFCILWSILYLLPSLITIESTSYTGTLKPLYFLSNYWISIGLPLLAHLLIRMSSAYSAVKSNNVLLILPSKFSNINPYPMFYPGQRRKGIKFKGIVRYVLWGEMEKGENRDLSIPSLPSATAPLHFYMTLYLSILFCDAKRLTVSERIKNRLTSGSLHVLYL